jgi:hypothetical protein
MNQSKKPRTSFRSFGPAAAATLALAGLPAAGGASTAHDASTYSWSAELVAVDADAATMTIEARLVTEADAAILESLKGGERVTLVWSGNNWAAGVRRVTRDAPAEGDRLTLPIEFVSREGEDRYVRFKVPVPSVDRQRVRSMTPGTWVMATSPRRAVKFEEGVATVRPYNDVG